MCFKIYIGILTIEEALRREKAGEGKIAELNGRNYFREKKVATIYTRIGVDVDSYKPLYDFRSDD
ncbi:hypothetical protein KAT80_00660 [Candidatus Pacearchaeota archaeon]|nr:hypothetical protein [Candidatus Pacearchaeota archaeon]